MRSPATPFGIGWRPQQIDDTETVVLEGEAVVFHPLSHTVHRLAATSAAVWLWCDGASTVEELAAELTLAFGGDATTAKAAVTDALHQLMAHGLLIGSEPPALLHMVAEPQPSTSDGSTVVRPSSGYLDEFGGDVDGDDITNTLPHRLVVRLGVRGERLVPIATDSQRSLDQLRCLLSAWLDDSVASELSAAPATFHVRLRPAAAGHGRRHLPSLRHGSVHLTQARAATPVAHALCALLAGIHDSGRHALPVVGLRAFAREDRLVFVDTPSSMLVSDRSLLADGIAELAAWQLLLRPDGLIGVAEPLPLLDWSGAGLERPAPYATSWSPAGMIVVNDSPLAPGALLAALARHCSDPAWFRTVADAVAAHRAQSVVDHHGIRTALRTLLTFP